MNRGKTVIKLLLLLIIGAFLVIKFLPKTASVLVEGTFYEAEGEFYGDNADELVHIEESGEGMVDVCWCEITYGDGVYEIGVNGLVENVPITAFVDAKYIPLLGGDSSNTKCINFKDGFDSIVVEGNLWAFTRVETEKDIEQYNEDAEILGKGTHIAFTMEDRTIDYDKLINEFKNAYPNMNYQYDAIVESVDMVPIEDGGMGISFYKKWYEKYTCFQGEMGILTLEEVNEGEVQIFLNEEPYLLFTEEKYQLSDNTNYVIYSCEDGTEFEYYPGKSKLPPVVENGEAKIWIIGTDEEFWSVDPESLKPLFDLEWYCKYNTFGNRLNELYLESRDDELQVIVNGVEYCSCDLNDYSWNEETQTVTYFDSTKSFVYYLEDNTIKIKTGPYTGQYMFDYKKEKSEEPLIDTNEEKDTLEETMESENDVNVDYMWFLDYNLFADEEIGIKIEVYQHDSASFIMAFEDISWDTEETHNVQYQIANEPDEIGDNGEFIYVGDNGDIVYYPNENYIEVNIEEDGIKGEYYYWMY